MKDKKGNKTNKYTLLHIYHYKLKQVCCDKYYNKKFKVFSVKEAKDQRCKRFLNQGSKTICAIHVYNLYINYIFSACHEQTDKGIQPTSN